MAEEGGEQIPDKKAQLEGLDLARSPRVWTSESRGNSCSLNPITRQIIGEQG